MTWEMLVAKFMTTELQARKRFAQIQAAGGGLVAAAAGTKRAKKREADTAAATSAKKGKRAFMMYRQEQMAAMKAAGENFNPATTEHWSEMRRGFESLPEERLVIYNELAAHSKGAAAKARKESLHNRALALDR